MSDLAFRPARPEDAAQIQASCLTGQPVELVRELLQRCQKAALNRRGLGLVAVRPDGGVVGFGQLTLWPRGAEISDLAVSAPWRGQGVGTALIDRLIRVAREMHADAIEIGVALRNQDALRLYRRLGFQEGRILELDLGDGPEPVMYLGMSLAHGGDNLR